MGIAMNGVRGCVGRKVQLIKDQTRVLNGVQVNSSQPLISRVIMAEITNDRWTSSTYRDRWIKIQRMIKRLNVSN